MSYIHRYSGNHYQASENLNNLFEKLIRRPFKDHSSTEAWKTEVINKDDNYHRMVILERGRTNFDESFNALPPSDKVLLYCVNYMPMHLYSSYHILKRHHQSHLRERIVFIDIGCGPLTSGIALFAAARKCNITYIGVDSSHTMLNKAAEINNGAYIGNRGPFFSDFHRISNFNQLPNYLSSNVETGEIDDTLIIFNLCYVLASHTFDDSENLDSLIGVFNRIASIYEKYNICVIYQNPVRAEFRENWNSFKSGVIRYSEKFNISSLPEKDSTKIELGNYETIWGRERPFKVSYDSFNNINFPAI